MLPINSHFCREPKLYHYETFNEEYLKDVLENHRIHCSNPAHLNDPWDCQPFFDMDGLKDAEARKIVADWFATHTPDAKTSKQYRERFMIEHDEFTLRQYLRTLTKHVSEIIAENWRIYCLTPDPLSTLMWSHYTKHHKGICLEFAVDKNNMFGRAAKVLYYEKYPTFPLHKVGAENLTEMTFLSKADCWNYEKEYRLIAIVPNRPLPDSNVLPVVIDGKIKLPDNSLLSIVLGCEMSKKDRDTINKLASANNVPVKEVRRRKNRFGLELVGSAKS